mmetsp:Transcript_41308/g.81546  ORF Transcript_41308/g.81546 Transcript_41308/m.81546 type:complete len:203 (+) Transcript_41308:809-1417(+)
MGSPLTLHHCRACPWPIQVHVRACRHCSERVGKTPAWHSAHSAYRHHALFLLPALKRHPFSAFRQVTLAMHRSDSYLLTSSCSVPAAPSARQREWLMLLSQQDDGMVLTRVALVESHQVGSSSQVTCCRSLSIVPLPNGTCTPQSPMARPLLSESWIMWVAKRSGQMAKRGFFSILQPSLIQKRQDSSTIAQGHCRAAWTAA